ncbi:unnamed protein product [Pleuronectes platessa]|uniref:Uncharacterized protein n=1 Tax=Pleuronectes platessa TaxID=8262 RepID=A0A9N7USB3_PLEPL|nr:unnamed protein product [Pleuronectes platessa]
MKGKNLENIKIMFLSIQSLTVPRLGEQSPSSPRRRRLGVRHASTFFGGGGPIPLCLMASVVWGAFFLLGRGAVSVGGDLVQRSAAVTLDACRALLADHLSYGARWGNPPFARGAPSGAARTGADQGNPTV